VPALIPARFHNGTRSLARKKEVKGISEGLPSLKRHVEVEFHNINPRNRTVSKAAEERVHRGIKVRKEERR
jgi:hypothetical protein